MYVYMYYYYYYYSGMARLIDQEMTAIQKIACYTHRSQEGEAHEEEPGGVRR